MRVSDGFLLATGVYAPLGGHRALVVPRFLAEEHALELHRARVREQERSIVLRHKRRARDHLMAAHVEIIENSLRSSLAFKTDLVKGK